MASEGFQQSSTHWYVTDLNLSLQFHHHGLVIIATIVVFIVLFMSFLVCNFLNQCNQMIISSTGISSSTSSSGAIDDARTHADIQTRNKGLDEATINNLPIFLHSRTTTTSSDQESHDQCSICLCSFEENEMVKVIPKCLHFYHSQCVHQWLQNHAICPLCRAPLYPSTSLEMETSASP